MNQVKLAHAVMNGYKMQTRYLPVIFAIMVQQSFAGYMPEFMEKCTVSDPKFDECVLKSTNSFINIFLRGNEEYGMPARSLALLSPTRAYNLSDDFHLTFLNLSTNFYQNLVITNMHFDFKNKVLLFEAKSPQTEYVSDYEADGEILGKPFHESGNVNMTFESINFNAIVPMNFKVKNDRKYLHADSCKLIADYKNFQFKPNEPVTSGESLTDDQKKIYQSYIDKIPEMFKRDSEGLDKDLVEIVNNLFDLLPFDSMFIT